MTLKKSMQKGFTVVELLIVIVVIGILAALVLNTFANVQKRARDTERDTDIKAISTQLEACYNGSATSGTLCTGSTGYPSTTDMVWGSASTILKGVDVNALTAPNGTIISNATAASTSDTGTGLVPQPTIGNYVYEPRANAALCSAAAATCDNFRLWYMKEDGGIKVKKSLNQP